MAKKDARRIMEAMEILQLRIALTSVDPPIWRRIRIPSTYTFWELHVAIQDSMGWTDTHLHVFRVPDPMSDVVVQIGIPDDDHPDGRRTLLGRDVPVETYLRESSPVLIYEYDFGDSWIHVVYLEATRSEERGHSYPECVAGERSRPPEDCGGTYGYQDLLVALADPTHPEHTRLREWVGPYFDPEAFDLDEVRFGDPEKRWKQTWGEGR